MKKATIGIVLIMICSNHIFSQNVGIGDINFTPQTQLHVHNSGANVNLLQLTNGSTGNTATDGSFFTMNNLDLIINNRENNYIGFYTNNTDRMRLTNGGLLQFVQSGTAAAPLLSWTADNNMGIFRPAADNLAFSTSGAERMRIDANGRLGVGTTAPNITSLVDLTSTSSGILIPRMTSVQRSSIVAPATGLLVYQNDGATGFYYYDGAAWARLSAAPANTEWWIRPPVPGTYIQPIANNFIRVFDSGQTYGIWYDGSANQYAVYARTTSALATTSAVVGFSDVAGNQTFGYLGYNGNYADGGLSIDGSAVYGVVDDPNRTAVFGRTTALASVAAIIGYSNVWIPGYFKGRHLDAAYAGRPGVYGEMTTTVAVADYQSGVQGYSTYTGATNTGLTVGGYMIAVGNAQDSYGVMGLASTTGTAWGVGVYGESSDNAAGSDYFSGNIAAVEGNGAWGNGLYNFGVTGRVAGAGTGRRQGGVFGTWWTSDWGALGYLNSGGTAYGLVYVGTSTTIAKSGEPSSHIGMGGYGDLMGGWIRGNVYGLHLKADRYTLYVDGKQYTNNVISQLNTTDAKSERFATYVPTSVSVDVYARGTIKLINGEAVINFTDEFRSLISDNDPVVVTVTPIGKCSGVYLEYVSNSGFKIMQGDYSGSNDKSAVTVSWIAIGTRKGYENPDLPQELLSKTYDSSMDGVMFNESDTQNSATPIWWDGNQLHFDSAPVLHRDPIIRKLERNTQPLDLYKRSTHIEINND